MPYVIETVTKRWKPEIDDGPDPAWSPWREGSGVSHDVREEIRKLSEADATSRLLDLGADIGRGQRDGWLYFNFLEELKTAKIPLTSNEEIKDLNTVAGEVADRMKLLGMRSPEIPFSQGGMPDVIGSRWFRGVLNWLMDRIREIGQLLIRCLEIAKLLLSCAVGALLANKINSSVILGIPPAVSFEIGLELVDDDENWPKVRNFLDQITEKIGASFQRFANQG